MSCPCEIPVVVMAVFLVGCAVIAFPGRRGTADMVSRARRAGVEVIEVKP
jgi:hypothetical protein